jgi:NADH-quinone oxidoreductase subunit J
VDLSLFYLFGALTVAASFFVIAQRNPMHSVILLIASFIGLAGLYVLLDAPFTAVTQIIVYAGAIMVLFLFVVMLLNAPREEAGRRPAPPPAVAGAAVAACCRRAWLGASREGQRGMLEAARPIRPTCIGPIDRQRAVHRLLTARSDFDPDVAMVGAVVLARREA